VAISDIVMENYTPRVMPQFGLAYEELRAINPQLIMISLSGFGSTGPWRDFVSFAWPTEEATGFPHLTGYQNDDVPRLWGPAGADMFAGLTGAVAVMAALEYRRKSNRGQYIDLSQVEALSTWLGEYVVDYSRSGHEPQRLGNRDDAMAPHGVYPTEGEDSWIAIAVEDDAQWRQLCQVIGRDDWSSRPSLRHLSGRIGAHDELDKGISEWSVRQTSKWSAARLLQNSGVAAAPVLGGSELIRDPQLIARGFVDWRDRKWIGRAAYAGNWAHFSATPAYCSRPAPTLGQDNERILKDLLGISDEEYNSLESDGIIGTAALVKDAP
jgi:crotonobetainyl-CoA:carnitine CoA-transferase CaiB-like acyl-CoA transferase